MINSIITLLYANSFQDTNRDFDLFIPLSLHYLKQVIAGLTTLTKGNVNAVVFLYLKKAFYTVDHDMLLSKLMKYGG